MCDERRTGGISQGRVDCAFVTDPLPDGVPAALSRLTQGLAAPEPLAGRDPRGGRQAAVLALVGDVDVDPYLVFIEKLATLRFHAGQMAFPGGRVEPEDANPVAAALREAEEEAGIDPNGIEVLGILPPAYILASDFDVTAVVSWWRRPHRLHAADPNEVEAVHRVRVADLVSPENRSTSVHPWGFRGPAFTIGDLYIWGFTGQLVAGLLDIAGWSVPWDTGLETEIPPRFLHGRKAP